MILQAGDLGIELDTGLNQPGAVLQRLVDGEWQDYPPDEPLTWPFDYETLPAGRYRVVVD